MGKLYKTFAPMTTKTTCSPSAALTHIWYRHTSRYYVTIRHIIKQLLHDVTPIRHVMPVTRVGIVVYGNKTSTRWTCLADAPESFANIRFERCGLPDSPRTRYPRNKFRRTAETLATFCLAYFCIFQRRFFAVY